MAREIPDFIEELLKHNIPVTLTVTGFYINGFYKSSGVTLDFVNGEWIATARYGEKETIATIQDLVALNYSWWQSSKDRHSGWLHPDEDWVPLLLEYNYIKPKVIPARTVYE